jgi:hypothetical protein
MKRLFTIGAIVLFGHIAGVLHAQTGDNVDQAWVTQNLTSMPLAFTQNVGQWPDSVLYRADAGGATMWFTTEGAVYQFTRSVPGDEPQAGPVDPMRELDREPEQYESMTIRASFAGANSNPQVVGLEEMEYKCNYFIGNDPNEWHTDVPNYEAIVLEEVYDGIDLKYYGNGKQMEYDFIVSPGADFSQIQIEYEGAESISVNASGELVVETEWGEVVEQKPVIYQMVNNSRIPVTGVYSLKSDNSFGFKMTGDFDSSLPLVIDPVLTYSTFLAGSDSDVGCAIAVDGSGCAFVTGWTMSSDFPTENAWNDSYNGDSDVFVTKFSASGNSLLYSTFLGGGGTDLGYSIAIDGSGCAYVTGCTYSSDFPTENAWDDSFNGGNWDVFVTKFSAAGNTLLYSTFLGGSDYDLGYSIAIDGSGCAYVTGYTTSSDFPTENAWDDSYNGDSDVFVTKFSAAGNTLLYSTFLGGSDSDVGYGIAVDGSGCAYVTGCTYSSDFPTENAWDYTLGSWDVFVTKFSASGNSLLYSTFLGGGGYDYGRGIGVDGSSCAYVTGYTTSSDFPTENAWDDSFNGGSYDAFVTKFSAAGNSLLYSTFLAGSDSDVGYGIAVDGSGCAYVTGRTESSDFPTENAWDDSYNGGDWDVFVTKFSEPSDVDGDGVLDDLDNCPASYNPNQEDNDGDDVGDACDLDDDNDGVVDATDTDPLDPDVCEDSDSDGCDDCAVGSDDFGPLADNLPSNDGTDTDADGICDAGDNCPLDANPGQEDSDGDNIGDVCDGCCVGRVGDANGQGDYPDEVTLADIMLMVDALFISSDCTKFACPDEADVNQSGGVNPLQSACLNYVTLGDIMILVDFLFITGPETAVLPDCL